MTNEQLIKIIIAFQEGKEIESFDNLTEKWRTAVIGDMSISKLKAMQLRIKPE